MGDELSTVYCITYTYPVQVSVGIFGHVIVEHDVHTLYVHTPSEQVCSD